MDQPAVDLIIGGVFTVLWFLLRQKDANQAKQIDLLFSKHDEDAAKRCLERGFCGWLAKPFRSADLGRVLKTVTG